MALVYMLNNTFWILYFSLNIVYSKFGVDQAALNSMPGFIGGLVWQLLALGMFAFQFGVTLHFDIKHKNNKSKQWLTLSIKINQIKSSKLLIATFNFIICNFRICSN